ncbi:thioredoxin reductase 1, mitochondrial-like [Haematobia irritans]|uniref:thioredoxin reductase 1, mitochondrial-like n=1 Tax=Haematobia irritans TaxID=7368 RepID=UPI003F4FA382
MASEVYYDLIVIGGGSGGIACAREANALGAKTIVLDYVEPTPRGATWGLGGTCVNVGCIPKKHMHQAALLKESLHDTQFYGWNLPREDSIMLNWSKLIEKIQNNIKSTNWTLKVEFRSKKIDYLNGKASLIDKNTVKVVLRNGQERLIMGRYICIAAGNRPVYPEIPGAQEYGITSDDLFKLNKPPGKTLLVGAGYISMECAGFLRTFGYDVTVMVREVILRNFDQQMASIVRQSMQERGVKFLLHCIPLNVRKLYDNVLEVRYRNTKTHKEIIEVFETIIWAIGRKASLDCLNLVAVGIETQNDFIVVNDYEQTSISNVYAIGDIAKDRPQLTPVAINAGKLLAKRLFGSCHDVMNYQNIPTTLFTSIEYAFVGLSEENAVKQFGKENIEIYHSSYCPREYMLTDKDNNFCYIKIVANVREEQTILGLHFIGPNAGDVLQGFVVAMNCGLTVTQLFNTVGVNITNARQIIKTFITKRSCLNHSKTLICD